MKEIELKSLVGLHILSGVETGYINEKDTYSDDFRIRIIKIDKNILGSY